jgi:hypothetical protein
MVVYVCNLSGKGGREKKIEVQDQPEWQKVKVNQTLPQRISQMWLLVSVIPATQEAEREGSWSEASPMEKWQTLSEKLSKAKRAGGVAQVTECLLSNHKTYTVIYIYKLL